MSDTNTPGEGAELDFDAIYRGESPLGDRAPWDIDGPQPDYVSLEEAGLISGAVLDSGCGTGENALFLAGRGYAVTGLDLAPTAIAIARRKAADRGLAATFDIADALELSGYHEQFDTVLDSGLAHLFDDDELTRYAAALHHACRPGASVHVLGISDRAAASIREGFGELVERMEAEMADGDMEFDQMLPSITADRLRAGFADGWTVASLVETTLRAILPFQAKPVDLLAWRGHFHRSAPA
ncbi:class I SAM-dependent methyltransferase [Nocardia sp. NPDC052566]|uniref:class I SAM-dependent methyltransferase n=1 Tax=Nocardia sp. NPDC052566 TaxID=3364330 RepID=UPI0037CC4957